MLKLGCGCSLSKYTCTQLNHYRVQLEGVDAQFGGVYGVRNARLKLSDPKGKFLSDP